MNACKRSSYIVTVSKMAKRHLCEFWLEKELGDIHWVLISEAYKVNSTRMVNEHGDRLYSSFVRITMKNGEYLQEFREADQFEIHSSVRMHGEKAVVSTHEIICNGKKISVSLLSIYSLPARSNNKLLSAIPGPHLICQLPKNEDAPELLDEYRSLKKKWRDLGNKLSETIIDDKLFMSSNLAGFNQLYNLDPISDINGLGLLYFASYPRINESCEATVISREFNLSSVDWLQQSEVIFRDIHYYGNANPGDQLEYQLHSIDFCQDGQLKLHSTLTRVSDGRMIARIFTQKEVPASLKIEKKLNISLEAAVLDAA